MAKKKPVQSLFDSPPPAKKSAPQKPQKPTGDGSLSCDADLWDAAEEALEERVAEIEAAKARGEKSPYDFSV